MKKIENHGSFIDEENSLYYYEPQDKYYECFYDPTWEGWHFFLEYENEYGQLRQEMCFIDPDNETIIKGRIYTENILYEKYKLNEWSHYNLGKDKFYYKETKKWDDVWTHEGKEYISGKKGTASVRLYTEDIFNEEDEIKNLTTLKTEDIINELVEGQAMVV